MNDGAPEERRQHRMFGRREIDRVGALEEWLNERFRETILAEVALMRADLSKLICKRILDILRSEDRSLLDAIIDRHMLGREVRVVFWSCLIAAVTSVLVTFVGHIMGWWRGM